MDSQWVNPTRVGALPSHRIFTQAMMMGLLLDRLMMEHENHKHKLSWLLWFGYILVWVGEHSLQQKSFHSILPNHKKLVARPGCSCEMLFDIGNKCASVYHASLFASTSWGVISLDWFLNIFSITLHRFFIDFESFSSHFIDFDWFCLKLDCFLMNLDWLLHNFEITSCWFWVSL